jgi:anti-sigma factor ChrR (cupin superfamily)
MEEIALDTHDLSWEELRLFPGTGEMKMLRDESQGRGRTVLVRLPAGGKIVPHTHLGAVQHYVLEGEYETQGRSFPAGAYRLLPKDVEVTPISTRNGATILMIYDPIKQET